MPAKALKVMMDSIAILTMPVELEMKAAIDARRIGVERRTIDSRNFIVNNDSKMVLSIFL